MGKIRKMPPLAFEVLSAIWEKSGGMGKIRKMREMGKIRK
jgi:hypothetical protein